MRQAARQANVLPIPLEYNFNGSLTTEHDTTKKFGLNFARTNIDTIYANLLRIAIWQYERFSAVADQI